MRTLAPPWWALLTLPFGLAVGFATVAVPFVLRQHGFDMTVIATVSEVAQLPHVIKLLWAPVLDSGPRRRSWFFGSIAITALSLACAALFSPTESAQHGGEGLGLWVFTAFLFIAQAAVATSSSAVLAMMAVTVPPARRGAASGWQTAGNLAGTAAGGALVTWMLRHWAPLPTATVLSAACIACAIPAAFVDEVPPPRVGAASLVRKLLVELWATVRSREGWTGLLICLSPVGAGALTNLFSALATDYAKDEASNERLVVLVTGILGGIANAAGALAGGFLADVINRRLAYILCGALTAMCAIGMMVAPVTVTTFTAGCLAYQFANGLSYSVFYAFVLDLAGARSGVTTQLALFAGASNFAAAYVTWLDGWSYDRAKSWAGSLEISPHAAMLGMDALSSFVGIFALGLMMVHVRRRESTAVMS